MKKLFLLLLPLIAVTFQSQADTYNTIGRRTIITEEPKEPRVMPQFIWYGKVGAGYGLGKYEENYGDAHYFMNLDLAFGFQSHFRLSKFYWGSEIGLLYSRANINRHSKEDDSAIGVGGFIDLTIGYKTPISSNITLDIHAAPEFKIGSAPKYDDFNELWQRANYGLKAGAGIWIKRLNIDLSVLKYFNKIDNKRFYGTLPPYLTLSFGYQF